MNGRGEVFEIMPDGTKRKLGQVVSISHGGHPIELRGVVIEIEQLSTLEPLQRPQEP